MREYEWTNADVPCPVCSTLLTNLSPGNRITCQQCGLSMTYHDLDEALQFAYEIATYGYFDKAYGWHDDKMIQYMPLADFTGKIDPEPGQLVAFRTAEGDEAPGIVLAVEGGQVKVDFNHPLAGHNVVYRVEILTVADPALS